MTIRKFAAIDIGTNSIRLLIQNVVERPNGEVRFQKSALSRVPIRLGADVFSKGRISRANAQRLIKALTAFRLLMETHQVESYGACATSAFREAANGKELAERIQRETGIELIIIDGKKEAEIISATDLRLLLERDGCFLYIDVGGGSTECSVYHNGQCLDSESFPIGTVRLLQNRVVPKHWDAMEGWVKETLRDHREVDIIGSGGNINKLHKLSGKKARSPLTYSGLQKTYRKLRAMDYMERIAELGLNPDRADVILPACAIFLNACKWSEATLIHVPKIGLADGMIKLHYHSLRL